MPKATWDIPRNLPEEQSSEQIFSATVFALCAVLVEARIVTRFELERRIQALLDDPEAMHSADMVRAVNYSLMAGRLEAQRKAEEERNRELEKHRPPLPRTS